MLNRRQIGNSVAWMAVGNWIEQAVNFVVFVLLARLLGTEAFGLLAMAAAFVIISEFLVRESLSEYLIASETLSKHHLNAAFWLLTALGFILAGVLFAISEPLAAFYKQPSVPDLMKVLSVTVLLIAPSAVPVAILRRDLQFRSLALRAICGVIAGGVIAIWMALNGYGVWSLIVQRVIQVLVNAVLAWAAVSWRPGFGTSKQDFIDVLGFGSTVLGLRAAEIARLQIPTVIIGLTMGPATLGLFSIAWRVIEITSFLIVTPLRMVSQPAFASLARQNRNVSGLLVDVSSLSGLIAFPAFFGLAVLSEPIMSLMFGPKWLDAAPILSVLIFLGIYLSIEMVNQSFCLAAGRIKAITFMTWLEVTLGAVMIWAMSDSGVVAMTGALVVSVLVLWIFRYWIISEIADVRIQSLLFIHIRPFLSAVFMATGVFAVTNYTRDTSNIVNVVIGVSLGVFIFSVSTIFFMRDRVNLLKSFSNAGDSFEE